MKRVVAFAILLFTVVLLPEVMIGQTISIDSVSAAKFCAGDPISVYFDAQGFSGENNNFVLQLSDTDGSFANHFVNLKLMSGARSGQHEFIAEIPGAVLPSLHYRLRILGSNVTSADNGHDIALGNRPSFAVLFSNLMGGGPLQTPITFTADAGFEGTWDPGDRAHWVLGSDATPKTAITRPEISDHDVKFSQVATYSTPGDKTVTLRLVTAAGCSGNIRTYQFHVYDCSIPSIPKNAVVINSKSIVCRAT
jgi:hypothetical protein